MKTDTTCGRRWTYDDDPDQTIHVCVETAPHIIHKCSCLMVARRAVTFIEQTIPVKGVWFVFGWDYSPYPIGVHDNELDAVKHALDRYGTAVFWEFGKDWDEVKPE